MKSILFAAILLSVAMSNAFAQGQVFFVNRVPGVYDGKVIFTGTTIGVPGPDYKAQLMLDSAGVFTPIGPLVPFRTGIAAG